MKNLKINANGTEIRLMGDVVNEDAYISLTDIAKYKNPDNAFIVVANWMRNHSTISFLGLWEQIHTPNFKPIEFDRYKARGGTPCGGVPPLALYCMAVTNISECHEGRLMPGIF